MINAVISQILVFVSVEFFFEKRGRTILLKIFGAVAVSREADAYCVLRVFGFSWFT